MLSINETENVLGVSLRPVKEDWLRVQGLLHEQYLEEQAELKSKSIAKHIYAVTDWNDLLAPKGKTHLLIAQDENGYLSAQYLDINDPYDCALFYGDYEGAQKIAEERLKSYPGDPYYLFNLAYAKSMNGCDPQDLVELYSKVLEKQPDNSAAWNNIARAWDNQGNFDQSLHAKQMALSLDPQNALYVSNLADTYRYQGDIHKALEVAQSIFDLPQNTLENKIFMHNLAQEGIRSKADIRDSYANMFPDHFTAPSHEHQLH